MTASLDDVQGELQALAEHTRAKHASPALAWGVMLDGHLALGGGAGALDDERTPTSDTAFRIASMTKSFTAATVLALRDQGRIPGLDVAVPGVVGPTSDSPPVTLRMLLSMGAGFAEDDPWADRHMDIDAADLDRFVSSGITFAAAPATSFEYSNLGFGLVGRLVHQLTGERSQAHTEHVLLGPLGLARTSWTAPTDDDWARPHHPEDGAAQPAGALVGDGALAPMGGLWSSIDDLVSWMAWLEDAFPARDDPDDGPLSRSSRRELQQVHRATQLVRSESSGDGLDHVPARIDGGGYGYGHQVLRDDRFGTIVGHSGGLPGYGSNMRWLPGRRAGAVALANSTYAPMGLLTRRMLELLDDHGVVAPAATPVTPALRDAAVQLAALLSAWGDDAADALFADNVAADESYERRAATAAALVAEHGALTLEQLVATTATAGTITLAANDGSRMTVELMLSPHVPPLVQRYAFR